MLKFGLHRSIPSSPNFAQKWPTSCWFRRWRHSTANYGRMVRYSAMITYVWRAYENPPSLFRMVRSTTPIRHSLPTKWGSQMHPTGRNSRRLLPPGEYDRRYRQNFFFIKSNVAYSPNYFGPCYFIVSMCIWHYNRLIIIIRLLISLTIALSSDNRPAYPLSVQRITLSIYLCSQIAVNLPHRPLPVSYRVLSETVTLELFVFLFVQNQRRLARTTESSTVTRAVCLSVTGPRVPKIQRAESRPGVFLRHIDSWNTESLARWRYKVALYFRLRSSFQLYHRRRYESRSQARRSC